MLSTSAIPVNDAAGVVTFTTLLAVRAGTRSRSSTAGSTNEPRRVNHRPRVAAMAKGATSSMAPATRVTVQGAGAVGSKDGDGRPQLAASQASVR